METSDGTSDAAAFSHFGMAESHYPAAVRVIIHAGMHKTGTTSLQRAMYAARPTLRAARIDYAEPLHPDLPQHSRLLDVRPSTWSPEACRSVVERAEAEGMVAVFLSGEVVSTLSAPELKRLVDAFRPWPVDLVVCLRRWSGFLPSLWGQFSKRRDSQTFGRFLRRVMDPSLQHPAWRLERVLDALALSGARSVRAVSFDWAVRDGRSIVAGILEAAGIEPATISAVVAHAGHFNRPPHHADLELWRVLNGLAADAMGIEQDAKFLGRASSTPVAAQFEFPEATRHLDAALRDQFRRMLDAGPKERLRVGDDLGHEGLIREVHGHRFVSLPPEGLFGPKEPPYVDLESSAMEWRDFRDVAWMQSLVREELGRLGVVPSHAGAACVSSPAPRFSGARCGKMTDESHGGVARPSDGSAKDDGSASMIIPFEDNTIAESLGVAPEVHVEDHLFRFLSQHPQLKDQAQEHYFRSARESAERVRALILGNRVPHGLARIKPRELSLLDFASGFGMVNRHFRQVMPEAKVEACDIHPAAVEFHRQHLGLTCHLSSADPGTLGIDRRYDVVLALSFFSHMPERLWLPWLEALAARVNEGGLLIFTTHGPSSAVSMGGNLVEKGVEFSFAPHSEQLDLDRETYGTTYAHPRFAMDVLRRLPGMHLSEFKMGAWWGGNQDAYVLVRRSGDADPVPPAPMPPAKADRPGWLARVLGKRG